MRMNTEQVAAPALAALQTRFQAGLLAADPEGDDAAALQRHIRPGGIGVHRRLAIYHHAYRARLADALADTFSHTATYLGEDWFDRDARAYIETHPSTHPSLRDYGAGFAAWLTQRYPDDGDIGELAALGWALRHAFDGTDATPLSAADLAAVPGDAWQDVQLQLHPTVERLLLRHNTLALWQALDQDQAPPPAQRLSQCLPLLVWRRELQPHFRSLGAMEATAIDALQQGLRFGAVCEGLSRLQPERSTAEDIGVLLRRWVDEGLLVGAFLD
jgi:hypothetical protein